MGRATDEGRREKRHLKGRGRDTDEGRGEETQMKGEGKRGR